VTTALDNRRREERESVNPVMQQLEAQTKSFQAMTERLSSNIMADFEVMLQKQLSSSIEGYDSFRIMFSVKRVCYHPYKSVTNCSNSWGQTGSTPQVKPLNPLGPMSDQHQFSPNNIS